jgi:hypothetical protein
MKTTRVQVPVESIEDRNVLKAEGADWPGTPTFPLREKSDGPKNTFTFNVPEGAVGVRINGVLVGAQGAAPPEPPQGMNGPAGNKGSPRIVGVPIRELERHGAAGRFCDLGLSEVWIRGDNTLAPEIPVTDEMRGAGRVACGHAGAPVEAIYRAMRAKEPTSYDECTIESLRSQLTDAIARAKAAEGMILAIESNAGFYQELADKWKERARAAETRLAERDASFNRLRWRK